MQNINARLANLINANLDEISYEKKTWPQQFIEAMNVNGGDVENATYMDYIMHFLSFPWKVSCAQKLLIYLYFNQFEVNV